MEASNFLPSFFQATGCDEVEAEIITRLNNFPPTSLSALGCNQETRLLGLWFADGQLTEAIDNLIPRVTQLEMRAPRKLRPGDKEPIHFKVSIPSPCPGRF